MGLVAKAIIAYLNPGGGKRLVRLIVIPHQGASRRIAASAATGTRSEVLSELARTLRSAGLGRRAS